MAAPTGIVYEIARAVFDAGFDALTDWLNAPHTSTTVSADAPRADRIRERMRRGLQDHRDGVRGGGGTGEAGKAG